MFQSYCYNIVYVLSFLGFFVVFVFFHLKSLNKYVFMHVRQQQMAADNEYKFFVVDLFCGICVGIRWVVVINIIMQFLLL